MFSITDSNSADTTLLNLQRLFILRWLGITGQITIICISIIYLDISLPVTPLAVCLLALTLWNIYTWRILLNNKNVSDLKFLLQLTIDVLILTGVLYYSGGATNPFTWVFLLPVIIAATVLPRRFAWLMAILTTISYTLLIWFYMPLGTTDHSMHSEHMTHGSGFMQHVYGMWFGYVLSAGMVVLFVAGMANVLRERDRVLAAAREQALRDEQLVALGSLAAGAAHELGTPLGTMAIVSGELINEYSQDEHPDLNSKLKLIQDQIARCKQALSVISASAGEIRADSGKLVPADHYLQEQVDNWLRLRPEIKLYLTLEGAKPVPCLLADPALAQALTNILNNAADASPDHVEFIACWDETELLITINDRGPGLDAQASASLGKTLYSTKQHGLGMGLFLSLSTIERMGGDVQFYNRAGGGVSTKIKLPLSQQSI